MQLLKDVLNAWKKEVEKKPPLMTVDEAYKVLGLPVGEQHNEANVRKSYYKLAQMYHPDKNPQGRVSTELTSIRVASKAIKVVRYKIYIVFYFRINLRQLIRHTNFYVVAAVGLPTVRILII